MSAPSFEEFCRRYVKVEPNPAQLYLMDRMFERHMAGEDVRVLVPKGRYGRYTAWLA